MKHVAALLERATDPLEVVELAIRDDVEAPIFIGDWLVASR